MMNYAAPESFVPNGSPVFAVEIKNLVRRFNDFTAVDDINLHVARGQFFGFLGPNGAGKSTTIKMLTGLLRPTSGSIAVLGSDPQTLDVKRRIGVVPEDLNLFERLTGSEMLQFTGRMYSVGRAEIAARTRELLALMELDGEPKKLIVEYSHGMKKKLSLACALIHRPEILFLDEPFEGVDAIASRTLKNLLSRLTERGLTVFLTSHVLEIVERLCTDIAIIAEGRIVAHGSLEELRRGIAIEADAQASAHASAAASAATTTPISLEDYFIRVVGGAQQTGSDVLEWLG
jgi:ABC-2 type transport system ATP-binding protein